MGKNFNIYEKIIQKDRKINLKELINIVRDEFPVWKNEETQNRELSEYIDGATKGDLVYKNIVKREIKSYLLETQKYINSENIDEFIKQYYINYYDNLFIKQKDYESLKDTLSIYEKNIYNYFEKYVLTSGSTYDEKYEKLSSILYQENYGLGAIDEIADDYENINGLWTNNKNDVYIQFKGLKARVRNLFFEDNSSYENVIKNSTAYDAQFDISQADPIVFCSRKSGSRVTAIFPPVNVTPCLNIRNFNESINSLENLVELNTINEKIKRFLELLVKGRPNFSVIGAMGSGKTTFLRALMGIYDKRLSYLTIEASDELRLYKFLKDFDIRSHIYSKKNLPDICLEASYREDRDIILQGEVRTAVEAYNAVYVKNKVAKGSGDSYHAAGFKEYMITRRNLLMETGKYQNYIQAEMDLAYSEDIIYIFKYEPNTGYRYLEKISEIEVLSDESYRERVLIKYDENDKCWYSEENISKYLEERLLYEKNFSQKDLINLKNILESMKKV